MPQLREYAAPRYTALPRYRDLRDRAGAHISTRVLGGAMPAKRILFVEDEREVANMLGIAMRADGYNVDLAGTVDRALTLLGSAKYDLVVSDWRLPDGDGLDVADEALRGGAKTLILTGYLLEIPARRAIAHELLMKPVRPVELSDTVKRIIGAP
jgi:DNA-binding response OmpR family regulator